MYECTKIVLVEFAFLTGVIVVSHYFAGFRPDYGDAYRMEMHINLKQYS